MAGYLTPKDVAGAWHVSERYVQLLCERGELHAVRIGRLWRISPGAVEVYEAHHANEPESAPEMETPRHLQPATPGVSVFPGAVPWRHEVIEERPAARRRGQTHKSAPRG